MSVPALAIAFLGFGILGTAAAAEPASASDPSFFGTWQRNASLSKGHAAEAVLTELTIHIAADAADGLYYEWHGKTEDGQLLSFSVHAAFDTVEKTRDGDIGVMYFWRTKDGGFGDNWRRSGNRHGGELCKLTDSGQHLRCDGTVWDASNKPSAYLAVFDRAK